MNTTNTADAAANLTQEETIIALRRKCALFEASLEKAEREADSLRERISGARTDADARAVFAGQTLQSLQVNYFNPFISPTSAAETCDNLNDAFGLLNVVLETGSFDLEAARSGLELVVQAMWAAAQFEASFAKQNGGSEK